MKSTPLTALKSSLSKYLARVKAGEEIVVTEHGIPIAKVIPFRGAEKNGPRQAELVRQGIITPGKGKLPPALLQPSPVRDPHGQVLKALLDEREDDR